MLLSKLLVRLIQRGTLNVIDAFGEIHVFGQGEPTVTIQLNDRSLHWKLFVNPLLYAGEAYMDESLTVVEGSLYDFIALVGMNRVHTNPHPVSRLTALGYRLLKGCINGTQPGGHSGMSPIIMIYPGSFMIFSSTLSVNIPAPIIRTAMKISKPHK